MITPYSRGWANACMIANLLIRSTSLKANMELWGTHQYHLFSEQCMHKCTHHASIRQYLDTYNYYVIINAFSCMHSDTAACRVYKTGRVYIAKLKL